MFDPIDVGTHLDRGILFANRGDYEAALDEFTRAIRQNPASAAAYMLRGKALMACICKVDKRRGDFDALIFGPFKKDVPAERVDEAIADFNRAIELDPRLAAAYTRRGHAYGCKGDHDRALADYSQSITLAPNDAAAYNNRGNAYCNTEDYDKAIADYNQAISLAPNDAAAYNNRGNAYYYTEDYDKAIVEYTQAIELDPHFALAYKNRGDAYKQKGCYDRVIADYDRAIADYTRAIELDPDNAAAYKNRGWAYEAKGDEAQAQKDYDRASKTMCVKQKQSAIMMSWRRLLAWFKDGANSLPIAILWRLV